MSNLGFFARLVARAKAGFAPAPNRDSNTPEIGSGRKPRPGKLQPTQLSPAARAAFEAYPQPNLPPQFAARVARELEARRAQRGWRGALRRAGEALWQLELEGVALWRLALLVAASATGCALLLWAPTLLQPTSAPAPTAIAQNAPDARLELAWNGRDYPFNSDFDPRPQNPARPGGAS